MEASSPVNQDLIQELRLVFDTCERDSEGRISLADLANLSRTHVAGAGVEQLEEIFRGGEEGEGRVDFSQFCQQMISFMNNPSEERDEFADSYSEVNVRTVNKLTSQNSPSHFSPHVSDQGAFNENLKRSFEKTRSGAVVTSSPNRTARMKKKVSQARLSGNIPLVNTSSEDEAEDSFDRQIADSLSVARPMELQPPRDLLVRGSSLRSTVMKKHSKSGQSSPSSTSRPSPSRRMYPESDSSSDISEPVSLTVSVPSRLVLHDLERKVDRLTESALASSHLQEEDSISSGVDSLKADLEEDIQTSISLAKKHGEERLESERRRHSEALDSLERERDLERRNFQLRYEQMSAEREELRGEVVGLREKVELLSVEKTLLEQQITESLTRRVEEEEQEDKEEQERRDREEEMMNTVRTLSERVADQDQELAEVKEDNIVLRKQIKDLAINKENKDSGRFRIFGGNLKENSAPDRLEDPRDIRLKLKQTEKQLAEQEEANRQLNVYLGEVLASVMAKNPQILERN